MDFQRFVAKVIEDPPENLPFCGAFILSSELDASGQHMLLKEWCNFVANMSKFVDV